MRFFQEMVANQSVWYKTTPWNGILPWPFSCWWCEKCDK